MAVTHADILVIRGEESPDYLDVTQEGDAWPVLERHDRLCEQEKRAFICIANSHETYEVMIDISYGGIIPNLKEFEMFLTYREQTVYVYAGIQSKKSAERLALLLAKESS